MLHVNWLFFTGLTTGSIAFAAVHKIANANWSGMIIRFAEAAIAFLPVSLLGLLLIFTVGLRANLRPHGGATAVAVSTARRCGSRTAPCSPACSSGCWCSTGWAGS